MTCLSEMPFHVALYTCLTLVVCCFCSSLPEKRFNFLVDLTNFGICSHASLNVLSEIVSSLLPLPHTLSCGISEDKLALPFREK